MRIECYHLELKTTLCLAGETLPTADFYFLEQKYLGRKEVENQKLETYYREMKTTLCLACLTVPFAD